MPCWFNASFRVCFTSNIICEILSIRSLNTFSSVSPCAGSFQEALVFHTVLAVSKLLNDDVLLLGVSIPDTIPFCAGLVFASWVVFCKQNSFPSKKR